MLRVDATLRGLNRLGVHKADRTDRDFDPTFGQNLRRFVGVNVVSPAALDTVVAPTSFPPAVVISFRKPINELALAIERGLTLTDLASTIHAYPSYGFAVQQLTAEVSLEAATSGARGKVTRALRHLS